MKLKLRDGVDGGEVTYRLWGSFLQNVIDFTIMAFVIFIALMFAARWMHKAEEEAKPPADVVL